MCNVVIWQERQTEIDRQTERPDTEIERQRERILCKIVIKNKIKNSEKER